MDDDPKAIAEKVKSFNFDNYQRVSVQNPTKKDFPFQFEGQAFVVKAGATKKLPGYVATHYIKHMAKILAQDEKKIQFMVDPALKVQYYEKLVIGVENLIDSQEPEPKRYLEGENEVKLADNSGEEAFSNTDEPGDTDETTAGTDEDGAFGFNLNGVSYVSSNGQFTKDGDEIPEDEFVEAQKEAEGEPKQ